MVELDADADVDAEPELLEPELLDPGLVDVPMLVHLWVDVPEPLVDEDGAPAGAPCGGADPDPIGAEVLGLDPVDPEVDVVVPVLAVVTAGCVVVADESVAPATSMPIPRLSPSDPATTPAATKGRESFMRHSFHCGERTVRSVTHIEKNGDKAPLGAGYGAA